MHVGPQYVYSRRSEGLVSRIGRRLRAGGARSGLVRWTEVIPAQRWEGVAQGRQFFVITAEEQPEGGEVFKLTHRPDNRAGVIDIRDHAPTASRSEAAALADLLARAELARRQD